MSTRRGWMWTEAVELVERAERLHRQFFLCKVSDRLPNWEPPVDIFETEAAVIVLVALPGVPPDQIQVELEGGLLRVSGIRPLPAELREAGIQRLEIPHGRFERRLELPPGAFELDHQELANGLLLIGLRTV